MVDRTTTLYALIINHDKSIMKIKNTSKRNQNNTSDLIIILKLRFVKGEITKQEFEEMKKMLE